MKLKKVFIWLIVFLLAIQTKGSFAMETKGLEQENDTMIVYCVDYDLFRDFIENPLPEVFHQNDSDVTIQKFKKNGGFG